MEHHSRHDLSLSSWRPVYQVVRGNFVYQQHGVRVPVRPQRFPGLLPPQGGSAKRQLGIRIPPMGMRASFQHVDALFHGIDEPLNEFCNLVGKFSCCSASVLYEDCTVFQKDSPILFIFQFQCRKLIPFDFVQILLPTAAEIRLWFRLHLPQSARQHSRSLQWDLCQHAAKVFLRRFQMLA